MGSDFHWIGAAGTADLDRTKAVKGDTPIFNASITRMYTAAVMMILEERGRLSLEDPLSNYLPADLLEGLHIYKGRDYSDQLTVYHLISQTSGLPDYFEGHSKGELSIYDRLVSEGDIELGLEDAVRIAKSGPSPKFPPKTKEQERSGNKAHLQ